MNMYSTWQSGHSIPVQPIQPWQLADAHHAVHLAEQRLAEAEHAFARETEQLLTSIAAHEHSAQTREAKIQDLLARIERRDHEIASARTELIELRDEYTAETRRMREVVATHQRSSAKRNGEFESLLARFERSESALDQALQHNEQLIARLENLTRERETESSTSRTKLVETQDKLSAAQNEITRLQQQLDETETQHKSDVETLRQELSEVQLVATESGRTTDDLNQLCDLRFAELSDANEQLETLKSELEQEREKSAQLETSLAEKQSELNEVIELSESIDGQLTSVVQTHGKEVDQLNATLSAKDSEAEQRKQEMRELAAELVKRETEFKAQLDELSANHLMSKKERREELRELAQHVVRRETEFKAHIAHAKRDVQAEADRTIGQLNLQVKKLETQKAAGLKATTQERREELRELAQNLVRRENEFKQAIAEVREAAEQKLADATSQLQSEAERLQETVYSLEQSSNDREATIIQLNEQIVHVQRQAQAEYSHSHQQLSAQIEHLSAQSNQSHADMVTVQGQLTETEQTLIATRQQLDRAKQELQTATEKLQTTEEQLAAATAGSSDDELAAVTSAAKEDVTAERVALENATNERIAKLQAQYQGHLQQHETTLAEQAHQIQQLTLQLSTDTGHDQTEAIEGYLARISELESQLAAMTDQERKETEASSNAKAQLSNQSVELSQQVAKLQEDNQLLDEALKSKTDTIAKHKQQLVELKGRLQKIRSAPTPPPASNTATAPSGTDNELLQKYRKYVTQLKAQHSEQLDRCQRAEFAVTQLDRTVAWLEQNSSTLQQHLQREAAARRKAESALKQRAGKTGADSIEQAIATQIEMDEQIKRLTRELDATRKIRFIERQQADAELKKIRRELSKRGGNRDQRAA